MFIAYKVIFEIMEKENSKPFKRTYAFSALNKKVAKEISKSILNEYLNDMKYYSGSIKQITTIKF